jgi:hypothetical protein
LVVVGAGVESGPRCVVEVGRVLVVIPDVPRPSLIPIGGGVDPLAGVDLDVLAGAQRVGSEGVGVAGGVFDLRVGERPRGAASVAELDPLGVQAGVAASVSAWRVVVDAVDANAGGCRGRRLGGRKDDQTCAE